MVEYSIKEISSLIKDGTHGTHKATKNGIPLLSAKDISDGQIIIDGDPRLISIEDYEHIHKRYQFKIDDVLLTIVGTIGRVAVVKDISSKFTFQRSVGILRFNTKALSSYMFHLISASDFQNQLIRKSNASAQAGVYLGALSSIKVKLPPLPEQKKIANILSTVDEAIQNTKAQIERTKELKKGLMQRLFSEGIGHTEFKESKLGRIPKEWEVMRLGDLCTKIVGGGTPSKQVPEYWVGDIPWYSVKDMTSTILNDARDHISIDGLNNSASNLIPAGTLIIATRMGLGRIFESTVDGAINQDLKALFLKGNVDKSYFKSWFISIAELVERSGTGSTVKGIRLELLRSLLLPLPNMEEQKRIAKVLNAIDSKINILDGDIHLQKGLKKGLMQKLLTGEVRVKI